MFSWSVVLCSTVSSGLAASALSSGAPGQVKTRLCESTPSPLISGGEPRRLPVPLKTRGCDGVLFVFSQVERKKKDFMKFSPSASSFSTSKSPSLPGRLRGGSPVYGSEAARTEAGAGTAPVCPLNGGAASRAAAATHRVSRRGSNVGLVESRPNKSDSPPSAERSSGTGNEMAKHADGPRLRLHSRGFAV